MLTIRLLPVNKTDTSLSVEWADPVVTVYGVDYDLSLLGDGDSAEHEVLRTSSRVGDDYEVSIILPHGSAAPTTTRFPEPVELVSNGVVDVPVYDGGGI